MTKAPLFLLGAFASFLSRAESLQLPGEKFEPSNIAVHFNATNALPESVQIFQVVPQDFSPSVISNVMTMGGFTQKDLEPPSLHPSDKGAMVFATKEHGSHFAIIRASQGWIKYNDSTAASGDIRRPLSGVPNESDLPGLALRYLAGLGIERSQVAEKPKLETVGHRGWVKGHGHTATKEVISRGIFFPRTIDGIDILGGDGLSFEFGNDAKIVNFELVWRNFRPYKSCKVASTNQIVDWIKQGHTVTMEPANGLEQCKTLTVTSIKRHYFGQADGEPLNFLFPYAELEATIDTGPTNQVVLLYCPLISDSAMPDGNK